MGHRRQKPMRRLFERPSLTFFEDLRWWPVPKPGGPPNRRQASFFFLMGATILLLATGSIVVIMVAAWGPGFWRSLLSDFSYALILVAVMTYAVVRYRQIAGRRPRIAKPRAAPPPSRRGFPASRGGGR